jgi:hypothetical protein
MVNSLAASVALRTSKKKSPSTWRGVIFVNRLRYLLNKEVDELLCAINDAKTRAISNAVPNGQPTDSTKNTALAQTLAEIDNQRATMQTQVASQLFSSGAGLINAGQGAAGLSGQLYSALVQNDTTQAANTGKAIATLAAALNGKSSNSIGGINISTG